MCTNLEDTSKWKNILGLLGKLIEWIQNKFPQLIKKKRKRYRLKAILSLKNKETEVITPTYSGPATRDTDGSLYDSRFISQNAIPSLLEIVYLLQALNNKREYIGDGIYYNEKNFQITDSTRNVFALGGFLANKSTRDLLLEHVNNVKFACSQTTWDNNQDLKPILEKVGKKQGTNRWIKVNGKKVIEYDRNTEGYIVLIKLTGNAIFSNKDHGTVHICFGNTTETSLAAIECYRKFTNEIYQRLKHRKECYFAIIKCNRNGEIDFNNFWDVTDIAFAKVRS